MFGGGALSAGIHSYRVTAHTSQTVESFQYTGYAGEYARRANLFMSRAHPTLTIRRIELDQLD